MDTIKEVLQSKRPTPNQVIDALQAEVFSRGIIGDSKVTILCEDKYFDFLNESLKVFHKTPSFKNEWKALEGGARYRENSCEIYIDKSDHYSITVEAA